MKYIYEIIKFDLHELKEYYKYIVLYYDKLSNPRYSKR